VEFIRNYGGKSSLHEAVSELKEHVEKVRGNEKLAEKSHEDQKLDEQDQDQEIEHVKENEELVQFVEEHDKVEENEEVEDSKEERVQTENVQIKVGDEKNFHLCHIDECRTVSRLGHLVDPDSWSTGHLADRTVGRLGPKPKFKA
jgi:hypothetical protein